MAGRKADSRTSKASKSAGTAKGKLSKAAKATKKQAVSPDSGRAERGSNGNRPAEQPRAASPKNGKVHSIGGYLIQRLQDYGLEDVFGIPGDFVLQFYGMLEESPIRVIGTTREDCAGYAADGYARVHGLGAVCVTYCVGGLSLCNSIAGAYAEKSPVIVISGSPGVEERRADPLLHHKVRTFETQREVFSGANFFVELHCSAEARTPAFRAACQAANIDTGALTPADLADIDRRFRVTAARMSQDNRAPLSPTDGERLLPGVLTEWLVARPPRRG